MKYFYETSVSECGYSLRNSGWTYVISHRWMKSFKIHVKTIISLSNFLFSGLVIHHRNFWPTKHFVLQKISLYIQVILYKKAVLFREQLEFSLKRLKISTKCPFLKCKGLHSITNPNPHEKTHSFKYGKKNQTQKHWQMQTKTRKKNFLCFRLYLFHLPFFPCFVLCTALLDVRIRELFTHFGSVHSKMLF